MYTPFSLSGKSILVTGASSGIGRAIAIECAKMGAAVILTARNENRLKETLSLMDNSQAKHTIISIDLSSESQINELTDFIKVRIDGVVQCAGLVIPKPFQFISSKDLSTIMDVNYKAPVLLSQQLIKKRKLNN